MCGRFALTANPEAIQQAFNLSIVPDGMPPRYNIAPTQPIAVITNDEPHALNLMRWGLIPSWAKDLSIGNKMINARGESVAEKPAFRAAFKRRRCLIPSDGFFEWRADGGKKTPLFIHMQDHELFAMAGLWEVWYGPDGEELRTCTIITTEPNEFMANIHNRMPVILRREDYATWLSDEKTPPDVLQSLIKPYPAEAMTAYEVSPAVNRPTNDTPDVIEPVSKLL